MAVDEKTPARPLDFEHDVIQRRPITTQTGLHTADATSPTPGVLANDDNIVFTSVTNLVNWARSRSPWPLGYGLACCAIEMMAASMSHHDTARFGAEVLRSSPRQADVMIVAGAPSPQPRPPLPRPSQPIPAATWGLSLPQPAPVMAAVVCSVVTTPVP